MAETFETDLRQLIRARFPLLYLQTPEETRALQAIVAAVADPSVRRRDVYTWTFTNGLALLGDAGSPRPATRAPRWPPRPSSISHPWWCSSTCTVARAPNQPADPQLVRQLRDLAQQYRDGSQPRMLILVAPVLRIPTELENTVTVVDFPLPDQARLRQLLGGMIEANGNRGRSPSTSARARTPSSTRWPAAPSDSRCRRRRTPSPGRWRTTTASTPTTSRWC